MRRHSTIVFLGAAAVASLLLAGCGASSSGGASSSAGAGSVATASTPASTATSSLTGEITVLAAASLTDSFATLGKNFEAAHPGTTVKFSFGASTALATQVTQGAPADVFASASQKNMDAVVAAKAAASSTPFAKNVMEIAVPPNNPSNITQLSDLATSAVKVALCQIQVPCGVTAEKVFVNAKIVVKPVTREADVRATLAKVEFGEADAGVVYVTDVLSAGDKVKGVQIPADVNASTSYPIATLTASKNADLAQAFVAYVLSPDGQKVLTAAGFEQP